MSNINTSPSLRAKLKTKDAVNKIKIGSPKLQEVLRQRCRQRMRENRGQLFDRKRQGLMETDEDEDVHDTLTEIVRTELSQLATMEVDGDKLLFYDVNDLLSDDEALALESEILAEEEQWIHMEYERLQQDEAMMALFAEECLKEAVICPLCEKGSIAEVENTLACPMCDLRLPLRENLTISDFGKIIQNKVDCHSSICHRNPSFMLLPENNTVCLYLMCETCSTFDLII